MTSEDRPNPNPESDRVSSIPPQVSPVEWLEEHGDALFRFARRRVDTRETAEDLVQETLIAAFRARDKFEGRASVRTWLTGILHRKIIDHIRRRATERKAKSIKQDEANESQKFFNKRGYWNETNRAWTTNPTIGLENKEFWQTLDDCCQKLSGPLAEAFRLRDIDQQSTEEVCNVLGITATNLAVRLHRARLLLRDCLDKNWFFNEEGQ